MVMTCFSSMSPVILLIASNIMLICTYYYFFFVVTVSLNPVILSNKQKYTAWKMGEYFVYLKVM